MNEVAVKQYGAGAAAASYGEVASMMRSLLDGESDFIANLANFSSLLYHSLDRINWCGFYLAQGSELVLGPFQGKVACVRIPFGRGVCGTSASERRTVVVPDVNEFPGHIACDAASRSEIVVPLVAGGRVLGVLDIDSPVVGRFGTDDAKGLELLVAILLEASVLRLGPSQAQGTDYDECD